MFKKFDIRNQTLNWKVPTRNKKMAESAEENPLSYTRTWVYVDRDSHSELCILDFPVMGLVASAGPASGAAGSIP